MATWMIEIEGQTFEVDVQSLEAGRATVVVDGRSYDVGWDEPEGPTAVSVATPSAAPAAPAAPVRKAAVPAGAGVVTSPLPGLVLEVLVKPGDKVDSGDIVIRIEAMKMANEVRCGVAGIVADVAVAAGDTVDEGAQLLRIG